MSWISEATLKAGTVRHGADTLFVRSYLRVGWIPSQLVKRPSGLYTRSDAPDQAGMPPSFWPYMDGWVINSLAGVPGACVSWAEIQPNGPGTPLVTDAIDQAIAHAREVSASNPGVNWNCILRVQGGIWAPAWAKTLDGPALVSLAGGAPFTVIGKNAPGVVASAGIVSALSLHSAPAITSGSYVAVVDSVGHTAIFQITQASVASGGYQTVTAAGTDTWGWASSTTPLSGASGATASAALAALPEKVPNTADLPGFVKGGPTSIGRWWTPNYVAAVKDLYTKLAAIYDTVPEIVQITDMACMTTFSEPCLKNNWDSPADAQQIIRAGWTLAAEAAIQRDMYDFLPKVWRNTAIAKSLNPYEKLSATNPNGWLNNIADTVGIGTIPDPEFANGNDLLTYGMVKAPGSNPSVQRNSIVIENNSLAGTTSSSEVTYPTGSIVPVFPGETWAPIIGTVYADPRSSSYTTMYTAMARYGSGDARQRLGGGPAVGYRFPNSHIHFQTATGPVMGGIENLPQTLAYAAWLGAGSVEILNPYTAGMSVTGGATSQLAFYRDAVKANA